MNNKRAKKLKRELIKRTGIKEVGKGLYKEVKRLYTQGKIKTNLANK